MSSLQAEVEQLIEFKKRTNIDVYTLDEDELLDLMILLEAVSGIIARLYNNLTEHYE